MDQKHFDVQNCFVFKIYNTFYNLTALVLLICSISTLKLKLSTLKNAFVIYSGVYEFLGWKYRDYLTNIWVWYLSQIVTRFHLARFPFYALRLGLKHIETKDSSQVILKCCKIFGFSYLIFTLD